jgi:hypothetical protein
MCAELYTTCYPSSDIPANQFYPELSQGFPYIAVNIISVGTIYNNKSRISAAPLKSLYSQKQAIRGIFAPFTFY